ncbi:tetraspanin-5 [Quercus suber]|uniref:tetraspanin-5 n=1 Tax=Quercus suber TaxID=58331 RepID=UPI0032DEDA6C
MSVMSDCCKPPTSCNNNMATAVAQDPDCYHWNNAPDLLCYECDSCKPGVLENVRRDWHKLSVLNIVMFVFLIGIYSIGCCAFRNTKRAELNTLMAKTESNISNPDGITTVSTQTLRETLLQLFHSLTFLITWAFHICLVIR